MKTVKIKSMRECFYYYDPQDLGCQECSLRDRCKVESLKPKIYVVRSWYDKYAVIT